MALPWLPDLTQSSSHQVKVNVLLPLSTPVYHLTVQIRFSRFQILAEGEELDEEFFFYPL